MTLTKGETNRTVSIETCIFHVYGRVCNKNYGDLQTLISSPSALEEWNHYLSYCGALWSVYRHVIYGQTADKTTAVLVVPKRFWKTSKKARLCCFQLVYFLNTWVSYIWFCIHISELFLIIVFHMYFVSFWRWENNQL